MAYFVSNPDRASAVAELRVYVAKFLPSYMVPTAFVASLSRTAEVNPRGVRRMAAKLQRVDPEIRKQFSQVATEVSEKSKGRRPQRMAAKPVVNIPLKK